jgi:hypothetical protein
MPGSIVSEVTEYAFDINKAGNVLVLNTREGTVGSYEATLMTGAWGSTSMSIKKLYGAGQPRAFSSAVTVTADSSKDDMDTTGASGLIATVDTASGTASSFITLRMTCKGDRIDSISKRGDGLFGSSSGVGDFDSPDGGGGM